MNKKIIIVIVIIIVIIVIYFISKKSETPEQTKKRLAASIADNAEKNWTIVLNRDTLATFEIPFLNTWNNAVLTKALTFTFNGDLYGTIRGDKQP